MDGTNETQSETQNQNKKKSEEERIEDSKVLSFLNNNLVLSRLQYIFRRKLGLFAFVVSS